MEKMEKKMAKKEAKAVEGNGGEKMRRLRPLLCGFELPMPGSLQPGVTLTAPQEE